MERLNRNFNLFLSPTNCFVSSERGIFHLTNHQNNILCLALNDSTTVELLSFFRSSAISVDVRILLLRKLDEVSTNEPKVVINSTPDKGIYFLLTITFSAVNNRDF